MNDLLALEVTLEEPADLVSRCGRVLARFDHRSQDSGNVSWLVGTDDGDLFVKSAGTAGGPRPGGTPSRAGTRRTRRAAAQRRGPGGCLIYGFASHRLSVIDPDGYHRGPVTNAVGRMLGSTRFVAPEELGLGAVVDERTTVHTLAKLAWHFGTRLSGRVEDFCGSDRPRAVLARARELDPDERFPTVDEFATAWREARPPQR